MALEDQKTGERRRSPLVGARAIAVYIWGPDASAQRFYDLCRYSPFPYYKLGGTIYARPDDIDAWIDSQVAHNSRSEPVQDVRGDHGEEHKPAA